MSTRKRTRRTRSPTPSPEHVSAASESPVSVYQRSAENAASVGEMAAEVARTLNRKRNLDEAFSADASTTEVSETAHVVEALSEPAQALYNARMESVNKKRKIDNNDKQTMYNYVSDIVIENGNNIFNTLKKMYDDYNNDVEESKLLHSELFDEEVARQNSALGDMASEKMSVTEILKKYNDDLLAPSLQRSESLEVGVSQTEPDFRDSDFEEHFERFLNFLKKLQVEDDMSRLNVIALMLKIESKINRISSNEVRENEIPKEISHMKGLVKLLKKKYEDVNEDMKQGLDSDINEMRVNEVISIAEELIKKEGLSDTPSRREEIKRLKELRDKALKAMINNIETANDDESAATSNNDDESAALPEGALAPADASTGGKKHTRKHKGKKHKKNKGKKHTKKNKGKKHTRKHKGKKHSKGKKHTRKHKK